MCRASGLGPSADHLDSSRFRIEGDGIITLIAALAGLGVLAATVAQVAWVLISFNLVLGVYAVPAAALLPRVQPHLVDETIDAADLPRIWPVTRTPVSTK